MIFFDTETCGLHGMAVLIQWAEGDGEIHLHSVWKEPIIDTLNLIEKIANDPTGVVGFNLAFDWFHLCKLYTTLSLHQDWHAYPEDIVDELAILEERARDGPCLKPVKAMDLMLHARKGPYQSTMNRGDIRIKKIPNVLALPLAQELERRVKLKAIYFARKKNKYAPQWNVYPIDDDPDFKDIVLKFHPSNALKALAVDALGISEDDLLLFGDIDLEKSAFPEEKGYAPFALAVGTPDNWNGAWPVKIRLHMNHWAYNSLARKYAKDDVKYTRALYRHFGSPDLGDDDSELACMVGASRWRGYNVDLEGIKKLKRQAQIEAAKAPTDPGIVRRYIMHNLSMTERVVLQQGSKLHETTKKVILEELAKMTLPCPDCHRGEASNEQLIQEINETIVSTRCPTCDNTGRVVYEAARKAQEVLNARGAQKEIELYDKILEAGRFHASFKVIGTLSSRMAGADGLNPQGIKSTKVVRSNFTLAFDDDQLCGGDFKSFEITLADAVYGDPDLRKELLTKVECPDCKGSGVKKGEPCKECEGTGKTGRSIHAIFGQFVYPGMTYDDIMATKKTSDDKYTRSKSAVFAMLYGGEAFTLKTRLGVPIETAERAYQLFTSRYKKVGEERKKVINMFCSMRQPNGIGSKVEWHEPADYIESMLGFRRYFTLENQICKALFDLAEKPPKPWTEIKQKVTRRDREQTVSGALRSALFAAAFGLQSSNMRAAANHVIQSAGAQATKELQRRIWDLQPSGINQWLVQPMNVHDEIMVPSKPNMITKIRKIVEEYIEYMKPKVPLIAIDWGDKLNSWADK